MRIRLLSACLLCTFIACDDDVPAGALDSTTQADATTDGDGAATAVEADTSATADATATSDVGATSDVAADSEALDGGGDATSPIEDSADTADAAPPSPFSSFTVKVTEAIGESPLTTYDNVTCLTAEPAYASTEDATPFGTRYVIGCTLDLHAGVIKIYLAVIAPSAGAVFTDSIPANGPPRLVATAARPELYSASTGMTGFSARMQVDAFDATARTGTGTLTLTQEPVVGSPLRQLQIEGAWSAQW